MTALNEFGINFQCGENELFPSLSVHSQQLIILYQYNVISFSYY